VSCASGSLFPARRDGGSPPFRRRPGRFTPFLTYTPAAPPLPTESGRTNYCLVPYGDAGMRDPERESRPHRQSEWSRRTNGFRLLKQTLRTGKN
jgi:hypothetical protein